jgi:Leucine-rich repeat (LRR) protein
VKDSNNLHGSIPEELTILSSLEFLILPNNTDNESARITDPQTLASLGALTNLKLLDLSKNLLDITIPKEFGRLSSLEVLDLGQNLLKFTIPTEFRALTSLKELYLNDNRLMGRPETLLQKLEGLEILMLDNNDDFAISSNLTFPTSLKELGLGKNKLFSSVSPELGRLSNLEFLNLEAIGLEGEGLPTEIGLLTSIERLNLGGNALTELPTELGLLKSLCKCIQSQHVFHVAPFSISFSYVDSLSVHGNAFSGVDFKVLCVNNETEIYSECAQEIVCSCCQCS